MNMTARGFGVLLGVAALCGGGCSRHEPETAAGGGPVAHEYVWRTFAGQVGGLGNVDGRGAEARFCQPHGLAFDGAGNVIVADYYNYTVRVIRPDGTVTTLAGAVGEAGYADGWGNSARFDKPAAVAADKAGNVYVADSGNHVVRKISAEGSVTTLAGLAGDAGHADGTGRAARFRAPHGVAVDGAGNVYVADTHNHAVRKITPAGAVTTLAGKVEIKNGLPVGGFADGKGAEARFRAPRGVAVDGAGHVIVADTENAVLRKVAADGTVTTLAGGAGAAGYKDGPAKDARFNYPQQVAADAAGNVVVADTWNQAVRRVAADGMVTTVTNSAACFPSPRGVAVDRVGNVAVADADVQTVCLITPSGQLSVLAGSASRHGGADGAAGVARFNRPCGVVAYGEGQLVVSDNFGHTLRTVAPDGTVATLAGKVGATGGTDGKGEEARFFWPSGMVGDAEGNVYVADAGNHTLRKVAADGTVTTLAGSAGAAGFADGAGAAARFAWPADVALDNVGYLIVADKGNHVIRRVSPKGEVATLAGRAGTAGRADGAGAAARFNTPTGVAVDRLGNIFVADTGSHTLRKIVPGGEVTTLAGCAGMKGGLDGLKGAARFNGPAAVVVDGAGNVLVADRDNHMIRQVTPEGAVTTLGGMPNMMSGVDGAGVASRFAQPSGLAVDARGAVYVADACNNRIVAGSVQGAAALTQAPSTGEKGDAAAVREVPFAWDVFAGEPGEAGAEDGTGRAARFNGPQGLVLGEDDVLYVADSNNRVIRKVSLAGEVTTMTGTREQMVAPLGVALGADGYVFVTDASHVLWRLTPSEGLRRLAGSSFEKGDLDGRGGQARFNYIPSVAVDAHGYAVVADHNNCTLRRVAPDGRVSTLAGRAGSRSSYDGMGQEARFTAPAAMAQGLKGEVYVADGNRIRVVSPQGEVTTLAVTGGTFGRLDGIALDRRGNVYAADRERHAVWRVSPEGEAVRLKGGELAMDGSGWLVTGLAVDKSGNVYVADAARNCIVRGRPASR